MCKQRTQFVNFLFFLLIQSETHDSENTLTVIIDNHSNFQFRPDRGPFSTFSHVKKVLICHKHTFFAEIHMPHATSVRYELQVFFIHRFCTTTIRGKYNCYLLFLSRRFTP